MRLLLIIASTIAAVYLKSKEKRERQIDSPVYPSNRVDAAQVFDTNEPPPAYREKA